jgi:6-phosphogluconolactonase
MVAKLGAFRMTFTLPVLNAAQRVAFLVVGAEKAKVLRTVLFGKVEPSPPAQLVDPPNGSRYFLIDEPAAALLEQYDSPTAARANARKLQPQSEQVRRKPERGK